MGPGLPWTWIWGPFSLLGGVPCSGTSPLISVAWSRSSCLSVLAATCLRVRLS